MSVTQADLDALNAAIAQGESLVRKANGETVQYRSVAELIAARNDVAAQIAAASPQRRSRITRLYHAGRGF